LGWVGEWMGAAAAGQAESRQSLHQVSDGVGGFGLYIAADNGRDETCQGGAEIASGEVAAGEEVGQVFAEGFCGAGAGFLLGVVEAKVGMVVDARGEATAATCESERTQGHAVLWTERGHKSLLRVEFWDLVTEKGRFSVVSSQFSVGE